MFSNQIEENLQLQLLQERFAEEVYSVVRENLDHLKPWLPWATEDYSLETARGFCQKSLKQFAKNEALGLVVVSEKKIIGSLGLNNLDWQNRQAEIGYWLDKNQTGKGIMIKCCRALTGYAFDELHLNRVVIRCATENVKSRAIPERLGYTREGVLRQACKVGDDFLDLVVYSMLGHEWENNIR